MSSGRSVKGIPEFIYFVEGLNGWTDGPYKHPKKGRTNKKYQITEVPMDEPKQKKEKKCN